MNTRIAIASAVLAAAAAAGVGTGVLLHQNGKTAAATTATTQVSTPTGGTSSAASTSTKPSTPTTPSSVPISVPISVPTSVPATSTSAPVSATQKVHMEDLLTPEQLIAAGWEGTQQTIAAAGGGQYSPSGCASEYVPGMDEDAPMFNGEYATAARGIFGSEYVIAFPTATAAAASADRTMDTWLAFCTGTRDGEVTKARTTLDLGAGVEASYWSVYLPSKDGTTAVTETVGVLVEGNRMALFMTNQDGRSSADTTRMPALMQTMATNFDK